MNSDIGVIDKYSDIGVIDEYYCNGMFKPQWEYVTTKITK